MAPTPELSRDVCCWSPPQKLEESPIEERNQGDAKEAGKDWKMKEADVMEKTGRNEVEDDK